MPIEAWAAIAGAAVVIAIAVRGRDQRVALPAGAGRTAPAAAAPQEQLSGRDPRFPQISLVDRKTDFFGRWSEGSRDGYRVAFQRCGKGVAIFAGDFDEDDEQLSEIYLTQVSDGQPLPPEGSPQRLVSAVGAEGALLDDRFFLNATGGPYTQLRRASVRAALLDLSDSVTEVMLFESNGVQLITDETATSASLGRDTDCAIALHRALSA